MKKTNILCAAGGFFAAFLLFVLLWQTKVFVHADNSIYDVNRDGQVDISDVTALLNYLSSMQKVEEPSGLIFQTAEDGTFCTVSGIDGFEGSVLNIPSEHNGLPVKAIGDAVFAHDNPELNLNITSVTIPNGITAIGNSAFYKCNIEELILPEGLEAVGMFAFAECQNLRSVTLREGPVSIPNFSFSECPALETVYLPESLRNIGEYAFMGCENLKTVYFAGSAQDWAAISGHDSLPQDCVILFEK